jgi:hypothetical protein
MTGPDFAAALDALGWSRRHLANLLGCDHDIPTRWASGRAVVPPEIARWLRVLRDSHALLPPPKGWRRRQVPRAAE